MVACLECVTCGKMAQNCSCWLCTTPYCRSLNAADADRCSHCTHASQENRNVERFVTRPGDDNPCCHCRNPVVGRQCASCVTCPYCRSTHSRDDPCLCKGTGWCESCLKDRTSCDCWWCGTCCKRSPAESRRCWHCSDSPTFHQEICTVCHRDKARFGRKTSRCTDCRACPLCGGLCRGQVWCNRDNGLQCSKCPVVRDPHSLVNYCEHCFEECPRCRSLKDRGRPCGGSWVCERISCLRPNDCARQGCICNPIRAEILEEPRVVAPAQGNTMLAMFRDNESRDVEHAWQYRYRCENPSCRRILHATEDACPHCWTTPDRVVFDYRTFRPGP